MQRLLPPVVDVLCIVVSSVASRVLAVGHGSAADVCVSVLVSAAVAWALVAFMTFVAQRRRRVGRETDPLDAPIPSCCDKTPQRGGYADAFPHALKLGSVAAIRFVHRFRAPLFHARAFMRMPTSTRVAWTGKDGLLQVRGCAFGARETALWAAPYVPVWRDPQTQAQVYATGNGWFGYGVHVLAFAATPHTLDRVVEHVNQQQVRVTRDAELCHVMYELCPVRRGSYGWALRTAQPRACPLDALFFPQKAQLLEHVAAIREAENGADTSNKQRLSILLHALPGAGGTSFIAALAHALARQIDIVQGRHLCDRAAHDAVLEYNTAGVVVIQSLDAVLAAEGAMRKAQRLKANVTNDLAAPAGAMHAYAMAEQFAGASEFCARLRAVSQRGYVLVACTDTPDAYDAGAFDMVVRLGAAAAGAVLDIVAHCFGAKDDEKAALASAFPALPDGVLMPSVVKHVALRAPDAPAALARLVAMGQRDSGR